MKIEEAIKFRIREISGDIGKSVNEICLIAGMPPNTLYDSLRGHVKAPNVRTIKRFCEGANITLCKFFEPDYFNDFEEC